jgi:hypothetical protein
MAYHDMLMMELAQTYKLIYGSTPKRDCICGDRYGPADRWIETVMRIAGRRAEDRLQPQQVAEICLSEEASERIIETCSRSSATSINGFYQAWLALKKASDES